MIKKSAIYISSSILSGIIPFLLLPILTRYLSPEEYGQVAMFNILVSGIGAISGLSVSGAAGRRFFDRGVSTAELARFNGNCFIILLLSTSATLFFLTITHNLISSYLDIPAQWIYFGVIVSFFNFSFNFRLVQWQVRGSAKTYGLLQIINVAIVFGFSLLFVVSFELGGDGRVYATVITSMIIGCLSYLALRNKKLLLFEYNYNDIKSALNFGLPLIPHVLGGILLLSVDRLLVNRELGIETTGIYMVAVSLGGALNMVFNSINKAYSPWLFSKLNESNIEQYIFIVKCTYGYFLFLVIMSILAFFISPPILIIIVGERFHEAADVLPIIILGQVFLGMYLTVTNYIFYVKKTKYLSYITLSSGLINIILLLLFIPKYGIQGAAFSFMLANFWQFLCTWFLSTRLFSMPWLFWRQ
ncbi:lipopolysaccharide biosynthesis protein [Vibrio sp. B1Z05]|uniref:lipopolysaccharide biosynthesis protein n=1 Tax=Vibrio sp. B1Z05 TaxID=2654980 RepID=UPI00128C8BB5|nr:oligosaccharide flippase family protein [Vibrio sp. B1Z05]MPW36243.1 oligosaccharide flippase family protein [Vibrio sp. B1Z05]